MESGRKVFKTTPIVESSEKRFSPTTESGYYSFKSVIFLGVIAQKESYLERLALFYLLGSYHAALG
jgi:hypothetical protein